MNPVLQIVLTSFVMTCVGVVIAERAKPGQAQYKAGGILAAISALVCVVTMFVDMCGR